MGMSFGDFSIRDDFDMHEKYFALDWFILLAFLMLMVVILFNVFIGIAVSDIVAVLNEADIRFLSMRIVFALKMERVVEVITQRSEKLQRLLGMNFQNFKGETEFVAKIHKRKDKVCIFFLVLEGMLLMRPPKIISAHTNIISCE